MLTPKITFPVPAQKTRVFGSRKTTVFLNHDFLLPKTAANYFSPLFGSAKSTKSFFHRCFATEIGPKKLFAPFLLQKKGAQDFLPIFCSRKTGFNSKRTVFAPENSRLGLGTGFLRGNFAARRVRAGTTNKKQMVATSCLGGASPEKENQGL